MKPCGIKILTRSISRSAEIITGVLGLVLLLLGVCAPAAGVELAPLRPYARQIGFTGFTRPIQEMTVAAELSGICTAVSVDVGDTVGDNGVVAEIDATFVRLALHKNKIAQRQTALQLVLAKKNLARFQNLMDKKSTAQATYDETVLSTRILELTQENLKNEQENLTEQLYRHTLHAPVGWSVIERYVEPGEYARQGEPVLKLGNFTSLYIPFLFTYEELRLLQEMAEPVISLPDLGSSVAAQIYRVAPVFDERTRKIAVDLRIASQEVADNSALRGGVRGRLTLIGKTEPHTFLITAKALVSRYDVHWLIDSDGQQHKVVLLGMTEDGGDAIVNGSGLTTDARYIVNHDSSLHLGSLTKK